MSSERIPPDLKALVDRLDSTDREKVWGEIVVHLIDSNLRITRQMEVLVSSLDTSSNEATRINRRIMYLTIAVALSALVAAIRDLVQLL